MSGISSLEMGISKELDFFFENVMDTVVDYFKSDIPDTQSFIFVYMFNYVYLNHNSTFLHNDNIIISLN